MNDKFNRNRRRIIKAASIAFPLVSYAGLVRSQEKSVVMGTWGGDTEKALKTAADISRKKYGVNIDMDVGSPAARKTKIIAQLKRPKNSMDLAFLVDSDMYYLNNMSALHQLDKESIPLYDTIKSEFTDSPYSLPVMYSALVLLFKKDIKKKPTSVADLWNDDYRGRVGLVDFSFDKIIPSVAKVFRDDPDDFEYAYKKLMELKENDVRLYASNEAVGNAFKSDEIDVAFMWKGRAHQWIDAGLDIDYVVPSEGVFPVFFEMAIMRNSGNIESSQKVLGSLLEPAVQQVMAKNLGQIPVVDNSGLPSDVEELIGFNRQEREKFFRPDYGHLTENLSNMLEFWDQEFKA